MTDTSPHRRITGEEDGASAVEYGLLVFAIAAVITVIVFGLGLVVKGTYTGACSTLDAKASTGADCAGP
ncbi:MAG: Flp family type IVb pilin [Actinomycetia bacterium]|nr:Flp family type IVb pilin [Actinomycetes bacterium]